MPYKNKEERKKHYDKNKDEINRKRREYNKKPEVRAKKIESEAKWKKENPEKVKKCQRVASKKCRDRNRRLVFDNYGRKCVCCGESNQKFLTIDHINGGGTIHRKKIHGQTYIWLVKNNYPEGFQVLCFNCNWGKYNNKGICPHNDNKL